MGYTMKITTAEENLANMKVVLENWHLFPLNPSENPNANKAEWVKFAEIMKVSEEEARSMLCANCEYYNNSKDMMLQMDSIPFNKTDVGAGGRGYCHEFDFICHNLRTCQAWESRDFILKDAEEEDGNSEDSMNKYIPNIMMIGRHLKVNK